MMNKKLVRAQCLPSSLPKFQYYHYQLLTLIIRNESVHGMLDYHQKKKIEGDRVHEWAPNMPHFCSTPFKFTTISYYKLIQVVRATISCKEKEILIT